MPKKTVFYGTRDELAAFLRLNPTLRPDGKAQRVTRTQIRQGLKDDARVTGTRAPGVDSTGCCPQSSDLHPEDTPPSNPATVQKRRFRHNPAGYCSCGRMH